MFVQVTAKMSGVFFMRHSVYSCTTATNYHICIIWNVLRQLSLLLPTDENIVNLSRSVLCRWCLCADNATRKSTLAVDEYKPNTLALTSIGSHFPVAGVTVKTRLQLRHESDAEHHQSNEIAELENNGPYSCITLIKNTTMLLMRTVGQMLVISLINELQLLFTLYLLAKRPPFKYIQT